MTREANPKYLLTDPAYYAFGLTPEIIRQAIGSLHQTFDDIDNKLTEGGGERLGGLVELANLSAIVGNLFRHGVVRAAGGKLRPNAPHKYPDLLAVADGYEDVEIKVALERNKPKGHLIKPGPHILVRYVLVSPDGTFTRGKNNRGLVVCIWEVRIGRLFDEHFNVSNTEGDSGINRRHQRCKYESLQEGLLQLRRCRGWGAYSRGIPRPTVHQAIGRRRLSAAGRLLLNRAVRLQRSCPAVAAQRCRSVSRPGQCFRETRIGRGNFECELLRVGSALGPGMGGCTCSMPGARS